uniref:RING-type E3 ubiquitin transferase n=1 Tax=Escallonia herrerae TaxID=1293975 RepID=A0AA88VJN6_9ASTE|nr:hypothetical protein RJ639_010766 [Escallonia herrerae]
MLAAIISLLLVILFVLLLHIYAKWFLAQARHRSRRSVSVPRVLGARFHHHFNTFTVDTTYASSPPTKGLDPSLVASLPLFMYKADVCNKHGLECVICLSVFEDEDVGRKLPKCNHGFHVECIDMWLHSHSTCPICRAPVVCDQNKIMDREEPRGELLDATTPSELGMNGVDSSGLEIVIEGRDTENECVVTDDSSLVCSPSSSQAPLGGSLKRMVSRNRTERKVHPSSNGTGIDA